MEDLLITLDVDWAPDFAIDFVADLLAERGVRATWFTTHASPALERIGRRSDLFELGIHPNFTTGSTHGRTPRQVLAHCLELVPDATSVRSHTLLQSTPLLDLFLIESRLTAEVSTFLPNAPNLAPVPYSLHGRTLYRLPFMWEDDYVYAQSEPSWDLTAIVDSQPGMKIFNFHPIHVFLNSCSGRAYGELKAYQPLAHVREEVAAPLVHAGTGTMTLFTALTAKLAETGGGLRVRDLVARIEAAAAAPSRQTS